MKKKIMIYIVLMCASMHINAQNKVTPIKIGDRLPNTVLNNLLNFKGNTINTDTFKGKILIIDFWATWCVPCVKDLPRLDSLQKLFKKDLAILTVTDQPKSTINQFLKTKPSVRYLTLPVVYADTILSNMFPHRTVPHDVVIDINGKVLAILNSQNINSETIKMFIQGKTPKIVSKEIDDPKFDIENPLFIDTSGREILLLHRLITKHFSGTSLTRSSRRSKSNNKGGKDYRLMGTNMRPLNMYRVALLGRLTTSNELPDRRINLLAKNKEKFEPDSNLNPQQILSWERDNTYCYDFIIPDSLNKSVYQFFKEDLDLLFHTKSKVETKEMDCYIVKSIDSTKYFSTRKFPDLDMANNMWTLKGVSMYDFIRTITPKVDFNIVDESKYKGRMDISFVPYFNDPIKLQNEFKKLGLDLVKGKRVFQIITIEDQ